LSTSNDSIESCRSNEKCVDGKDSCQSEDYCSSASDCDTTYEYFCSGNNIWKRTIHYSCSSNTCREENNPKEASYYTCRGGTVCDSGILDDGDHSASACVKGTTTTTNLVAVTCSSNSNCAPTVRDAPYCEGSKVVQAVRWGECSNPGTTLSRCVDKKDTTTVEVCSANERCDAGKCKLASSSETTSTQQRTTTTLSPVPVTITLQATTTTVPPAASESNQTEVNAPSLVENLLFKSPVELVFNLFKRLMSIIIFWD
jgi:hypothetical protein